MNVDINNPASIAAALAQMKQKAEPTVAAAMEATVTQTAVAAMEPEPEQISAFEIRALPLIERNVPVIPLRPRTKIAFISKWENIATTDRAQIEQWGREYPDANVASVAKAQPNGTWFFEVDKENFHREVEKQTGQKMPETFIVRSSPGRGHFYFKQSAASIAMGNRQGKDANGKETWSARVDNRYVVGPGSVHPITGEQYEPIKQSSIVEAPQWLIDYCIKHDAKETKKTEHAEVENEEPINEGSRNSTLASILGKARQVLGMDREQLYEYGLSVNRKRCSPPLPDSEVRTIANSIAKYEVKPAPMLLIGGVPIGQGSAPNTETPPTNWRSQFRNLSEMEEGDIVMIIDGVLQEGTCFLGANPGHGKTLVALAFAKAICLGEPLFGIPEYSVKQPQNVIYLIPESGDRAFRRRGESFRLPHDDRFIARTISSGTPLALSDQALMEAVRQLKPVVILDTASRFLQANDENSAAQNRLLVNDIIALRAAGAVCVIVLHHAKKSQSEKRETMTLDNMLRGTSDFGAMCDQAYGIRMDEHLYNRGAGPMEIELVNLKDRERLGGLTSIRLAASYKKPGAIFPNSYIDETGNFRPVDYKESKARDEEALNALVGSSPMMTVTELCEATGIRPYTVKETLKKYGWHMAKGGAAGHSPWHKDTVSGVCPYKPEKKGAATEQDREEEVNLDAPAGQPVVN